MDVYMHPTRENKHHWMVVNAQGQNLYHIQGRWGRLEDRVLLYNTSSEELYRATQVILSLFPKFELAAAGKPFAYLSKHPGLRGSYFKVSSLGWTIRWQEENHSFKIYKKKDVLADIQNCLGYGKNHYYIQVKEEENTAFICLLASLLDHYSPSLEASPPRKSLPPTEDSPSYFYPYKIDHSVDIDQES